MNIETTYFTRLKKAWLCKLCIRENETFDIYRTMKSPDWTPCDYCVFAVNEEPNNFVKKKNITRKMKLRNDRVDKTGMKPLF